MRQIIPISDLQRQAASIVNDLTESREPVIVTQRGRATAVLISAERFSEMEDDLEILDDLELLQAVEAGERAVRNKDFISQAKVKKHLKYPAG